MNTARTKDILTAAEVAKKLMGLIKVKFAEKVTKLYEARQTVASKEKVGDVKVGS